MADFGKRLYGPAQLGAAAATIYTASSSLRLAVIREIVVVNTTAANHYFYLSVGADAAATRYFDDELVGARPSGRMRYPCALFLTANEIIQAYADAATSLTITLNGIEMT